MKKIIISAVVLLGLAFVVMSGFNKPQTTTQETKKEQTVQLKATISVVQEDKELAKKEVSFSEGQNLMEVLQKNFDIKEEKGMITAVEGVEQSAENNTYWTYTINDKMVDTGANDTILKEGDKVILTYTKF